VSWKEFETSGASSIDSEISQKDLKKEDFKECA